MHYMNVVYQIKSFTNLSPFEVYQIIHLRHEVFGLEQKCLYEDLDRDDYFCYHIAGFQNGDLVAYARILPPGRKYIESSSIGRVIVKKNIRKQREGLRLMNIAIQRCKTFYPGHPIVLSAQSYLEKFYLSFGFENTGKFYEEDGIPHQEMIMDIS